MVSIESAEPVVSVIIRAPAGSAEYQSLGEELLHRAREAGFSAEVIVVEPRSPPAVDEAIARAVGLARGAFVVFVDPASGFGPQTLSALVAPIAAGTHDLTIAVRDPGRQTKGLAALASGIKSWVSRLIFSPVAETRDPWSGWYALRRDRLVRLGQSGRIFPHDLPAVLIAAGSDLRIVDVRGGTPTTNAGGRAPGLREAWAWLRSGTSGAGIEPAGQRRFGAGAMGIAIDLATTLSLFAFGWTLGASNIAGFVAGALVHRAVRALWSPDPTLSRAARRPSAAQIGRYGVLAALALGLRGGAVATALAYGLPAWLAVIAGLTFGWGAGAAGKSFLAPSPPWPGPTAALRWSLAAVGILGSVFLLHLLYLKVLPLMPEEAYYWNYSVRPDLGYLDHPPMVAWLIALAEALFGHGEASIRVASLACGLAVIAFVYHFARRLVDRPAALLAAALAAVIPYSFFVAGLMITPDAPLAAAWAASLYFFHRALVGGERKAWYGAGIALGLGLLSKYSIATLGPAALAYCILDRRARGWFLRPEPYLAVLIAAVLFAPVVYWNYANEWASFVFQAGGRFDDETQFSLHHMLGNILIVATPLPVMVLPLLFVRRWTEHPGRFPEPAHARARNRLFVSCFVLAPLVVFAWSALRHLPRLNWTGPIWLATLPLLGWAIVRADALRRFGLGTALRLTAGGVVGGLLIVYAVLSYYLVLGIPGVPYPRSFARAMGWQEATRELQVVHDRIVRETGVAPMIVGVGNYFIASQVSFFGTPEYLSAGQARGANATEPTPLKATTIGPLSGDALMFAYWDPPEQLRGRTLVMVARPRVREMLATERLAPYFRELDPRIHPLPLVNSGFGGDRKWIDEYSYRIGYDYRPEPGPR